MGQLYDGNWYSEDRPPADNSGEFVRPESTFRDAISLRSGAAYPAQVDRYHLYVADACPWAHRVIIARELLGLQQALPMTTVEPHMGTEGWVVERSDPNDVDSLWQLYVKAEPRMTGRATVPVLWDLATGTIVNNESREILRMLSTQMTALHRPGAPSLCPDDLRERIDETIDAIYGPINNGVYRAGFARTQAAHESAVRELFAALDRWERVLAGQRWLCGDRFTEADICLFTTLVRFDSVYVTHFKCTIRRLVDYPHLWGFTRDVYQRAGGAKTVRMDPIKEHYYRSHPALNPRGLVPLGPRLDFEAPTDRARLGAGVVGSKPQ